MADKPKGPGAPGAAPRAGGAAGARRERDETDTFIDEVTEELRRDRLFALFKRYGPFAIGAVVLLVGGVAYVNHLAEQEAAARQAVGATLEAAAESANPADEFEAAISSLAPQTPGAALLARFAAADARLAAGETGAARAHLQAVVDAPDLGARYRDMAALKLALIDFETADPGALVARLEPLAAQGAPYRPLALELLGAAHLRAGDQSAALERFAEASLAPNAPPGVLGRVRAILATIDAPEAEPESGPEETGPEETGAAEPGAAETPSDAADR